MFWKFFNFQFGVFFFSSFTFSIAVLESLGICYSKQTSKNSVCFFLFRCLIRNRSCVCNGLNFCLSSIFQAKCWNFSESCINKQFHWLIVWFSLDWHSFIHLHFQCCFIEIMSIYRFARIVYEFVPILCHYHTKKHN